MERRGYNTTIGDTKHAGRIWRVSKGDISESRLKHVKEWELEADLTQQLGRVNIGPYVYDKFSTGSVLTEKNIRVALSLEKYTADLASVFFKKHYSEDELPPGTLNYNFPHYRGNDVDLGKHAGEEIILRAMELGKLCLLHADLKLENIMVKLGDDESPLKNVSQLKLRIIDYDPQFMYYGCSCLGDIINALPWSLQRLAGSKYKQWRETLQNCFFCVMNLLLIWAYLHDLHRTNSLQGAAASACYAVLTTALQRSSFPLDFFPMKKLPTGMQGRLKKWQDNYYNQASIHDTVYSLFPALTSQTYDWEKGPVVAGKIYGGVAPWAICPTGKQAEKCTDAISTRETRKSLRGIAARVKGMTCPLNQSPAIEGKLRHSQDLIQDQRISAYRHIKSPHYQRRWST